MKHLIISVLILGLTFGLWAFFIHKSDIYLSGAAGSCQNVILPLIEKENWESAYDRIMVEYKAWDQYKKYALLFYDSQKINDTECTFLKTIMYIKAKDLSNSSGELCSLKSQLYSIVQNDKIAWTNII